MSDSGSDSEPEPTAADPQVLSKYVAAGKIANYVMETLIPACVPGTTALDLCKMGDELIAKECMSVYSKDKKLVKGVGFPTSISVNNCICHYSPLPSDTEIVTLKDGDVVKIDLAAHIGGFIASTAHTLVVGCTNENPVTDKRADVIRAAYLCSQAAVRMIKPGNNTKNLTKMFNDIAASYECKPVEGMLSHQLGHFRIDGEKTIIQNPTDKQRQDHTESEFECHEVYAVDCLVSTGEGRPKDRDSRTTIFKRNPDIVYQLKMKASRMAFSEIEKKFSTMCFSLRSMEDEKRARLGIVECVKHSLCTSFPVMWEKDGEFVAQFKFTIIVTENFPNVITKSYFDEECYKSSHKITDQKITELLSQSVNKKSLASKKKKANKKAKARLTEVTAGVGDAKPQ